MLPRLQFMSADQSWRPARAAARGACFWRVTTKHGELADGGMANGELSDDWSINFFQRFILQARISQVV